MKEIILPKLLKPCLFSLAIIYILSIISCSSDYNNNFSDLESDIYSKSNNNLNNYQNQVELYKQANNILKDIPNTDNNNIKNNKLLSAAKTYLIANLAQKAEDILNNIDTSLLSIEQAKQYNDLLNNLNIKKEQQINNINTTENSELKLWQKLLAADNLNYSSIENNDYNGWVKLANIIKNDNNYYNIINWQEAYPEHPANKYLTNLKFDHKDINTIAVLLPLTGKLAPYGKTIKAGIVTAYYNDANKNKPKLIYLDTESNSTYDNIVNKYKEAQKNQADLIIGPLDKEAVNNLYKYTKNNIINNIFNKSDKKNNPKILALNYIPELSEEIQKNNPNFYQLGLSQEDEAKQAAIRSIKNNYKKALIIINNNNLGKRTASAYKQQFELDNSKSSNNAIAGIIYTDKNSDYKNVISKALNIDTSISRKSTLQWIIGSKLDFSPRRRQDFDHIFLAASDLEANRIKPLLKFYYADNIPIISTSSINSYTYKYSDVKNNYNNYNISDLNNTEFCDIPLLIYNNKQNKKLLTNLHDNWGNNYIKLVRLYALGLDSYELYHNLNILQTIPKLGINQNIGHLYLTDNNIIHRQLPWVKIKNGEYIAAK